MMETDEELARRLRYVLGDDRAFPRGPVLDRVAEEYSLKRRLRRDDFFNYGTKMMIGVDPGASDQAVAMLYSHQKAFEQVAPSGWSLRRAKVQSSKFKLDDRLWSLPAELKK